MAGTGSIIPDFVLKNVLYVPKLTCSLLSISRLTKALRCIINFSHNKCVFQNLYLGKRIGSIEEYDGLYKFMEEVYGNRQVQTANFVVQLDSQSQQIRLCHLRLSHLNFSYLNKLFFTLFHNNEMSNFH